MKKTGKTLIMTLVLASLLSFVACAANRGNQENVSTGTTSVEDLKSSEENATSNDDEILNSDEANENGSDDNSFVFSEEENSSIEEDSSNKKEENSSTEEERSSLGTGSLIGDRVELPDVPLG